MKSNPLIPVERLGKHLACNFETGELVRLTRGRGVGTRPQPNGYLRVGVEGRYYLAHRVVWALANGRWPIMIDHINGVRADNRLCNLREVTGAENCVNKAIRKDNRWGHPGISAYYNKFRSFIFREGRPKYLGTFASVEDAIVARRQAERELGYHPNHATRHAEYRR